MAKIPAGVVNFLKQLPEKDIAKVCNSLKIAENKTFKDVLSKQGCSKSPYTDSLVVIFSNPSHGIIADIYKSIEGLLFVGGCAPGVGIAFNIVDACFCIVLNNWIGAFISIISCFPIPGFKMAGKGIEKLIMSLLVKISPADMQRIFKLLEKQLSKIGFHSTDCYIKIGNKLEEVVIGLNNPFATETIKLLSSAVKKKKKNNVVLKNGVSSIDKYTIQPKGNLLTLTEKSIKK